MLFKKIIGKIALTTMNEIEYELREQDLTAFTEHQMQDKEHYQKTLRRQQIVLPAIMALLAFFMWFFFGNTLAAIYIGIIAIAWHYISPLIIKWNIRRQTLGLYNEEEKKSALGRIKLVIEPQTLLQVKENKETRIPWKDIMSVESTKRYAFIYLDTNFALVIPKKTVKGNLKKFLSLTDEKIRAAEG